MRYALPLLIIASAIILLPGVSAACDGDPYGCSAGDGPECTCATSNCAVGYCNSGTCVFSYCWGWYSGGNCYGAQNVCDYVPTTEPCDHGFYTGKYSCGTCMECNGASIYCEYVGAWTDPYNECTATAYCSNDCTIAGDTGECSGSGWCSDYSTYVSSGNVCSGGDQYATSSSFYCSTRNVNVNNCQWKTQYEGCGGTGSCNGAWVDGTTTTCAVNQATRSATSCTAASSSNYCQALTNACAGSGSPYSCLTRTNYYGCASSGSSCEGTSRATTDTNTASGKVCSGGTEQTGSSTYYSSTGDSGACSSPGTPSVGFGDRVFNYYACDGAGGVTGPGVGTFNTDCTTGCCLDSGATTSCVGTGSVAYNFYNFGTGDGAAGAAADYCINAVVKDCSTVSECTAGGSYSCQYNNCLATSGRIMVQTPAGADLAIFDQYGRIILKGLLYESTGTTPPAGSWQIQNGAGTPMGWVTSAGHLYLKGTASQSQGSVTPAGNNDFIIQNAAGTPVAYIDGATGNLYTLSTITTSTIP